MTTLYLSGPIARRIHHCQSPPMEEPAWPAWVMAKCPSGTREIMHVLRLTTDGFSGFWECRASCRTTYFDEFIEVRPLTDDERAEYGIPGECTRPHAEPITDELVEQCANVADDAIQEDWLWSDVTRTILRAAGHTEADR